MQQPAFGKTDIASWFGTYSNRLHDDPYPFYDYLLEQEPVHYIEERWFWIVSRYEDVNRILKDPVFVREYRNAMPEGTEIPEPPPEWKPVNELLNNWMLLRDAPAHTRLRSLVSHAFTPRTMQRLKTGIQEIADYLADRMEEEGRPDLIASFAFTLPVIVIAELLGVPPEDRELFKDWSHVFAKVLEGSDQTPQFAEQTMKATSEITEYFRLLIAERRAAPREDMISDLLAAQEKSDALTEQEMIATCVLLLVAGHETTVNLIGNAVRLLLTQPDQHALLLERPELIASAIEEVLRYEGPVQTTSRIASADCEIGGKTIPRGQSVIVMLGAANRDPAQFNDPNRFDIARQPNRHLAFATGAHFCLGAPLARLEGEIAIRTLLNRFPHMRLAEDRADWRPNILFRGLQTLPVIV
ncbi:cytochrome P450 [Paenibacillus rhizovicinus]|uniref:Cytochrome P450 n=1 Tax=Paenibacillus rhizovicinus TaxID=2704463 RepID=A0A6C0P9L8_9BACL|nr:cytochrome P450 [Paenibacillus rhizovicinus]QHW35228.1 cytochrome P450 [Paenibacillus rhizovicinus]